jgi:hypothetical protein
MKLKSDKKLKAATMQTTTLIPIESGDAEVRYEIFTPKSDNSQEPI